MDNGQIIEQGTLKNCLPDRGVITSLSRVCKLLLNDPTCVEFCGHAPGSAFSPFNSLPSPEGALREPNGLLALGAIFSPARLLMAYQRGIFRGFSWRPPLVVPIPAVLWPESLHISHSERFINAHPIVSR